MSGVLENGFHFEIQITYVKGGERTEVVARYPTAKSIEVLRKALKEKGGNLDEAIKMLKDILVKKAAY